MLEQIPTIAVTAVVTSLLTVGLALLVFRRMAGKIEARLEQRLHDKLEALEQSSIDYYAALRSAYIQSRRAAVAEVRGEADEEPDGEPVADSQPIPVLENPQSEAPAPQVRADVSAP